jgi:hypothetical protein
MQIGRISHPKSQYYDAKDLSEVAYKNIRKGRELRNPEGKAPVLLMIQTGRTTI